MDGAPVGSGQIGLGLTTLLDIAPGPEIWLDWAPSTDNTDTPNLIRYDVCQNGVSAEHGSIGAGETIVYCVASGPAEVVVRAVDTSGYVSGPRNAITFDCRGLRG